MKKVFIFILAIGIMAICQSFLHAQTDLLQASSNTVLVSNGLSVTQQSNEQFNEVRTVTMSCVQLNKEINIMNMQINKIEGYMQAVNSEMTAAGC